MLAPEPLIDHFYPGAEDEHQHEDGDIAGIKDGAGARRAGWAALALALPNDRVRIDIGIKAAE